MYRFGVVALAATLAGCAIQRAEIAQDARAKMVGMPKEQVLACMGVPVSKASEGATEVWTYNSSNGAVALNPARFCRVNVVMSGGQVSAVNYLGQTGGLLTSGEQCAYAVDACVKKQ
ncbi:hypothetical protein [Bradyrhizobium guangdongense]